MTNEEQEDKNKIIKSLKDFGRLPTSRISAICGFNPDKTKRLLEELFDNKEIIKHEETLATYWEINKKGEKNAK